MRLRVHSWLRDMNALKAAHFFQWKLKWAKVENSKNVFSMFRMSVYNYLECLYFLCFCRDNGWLAWLWLWRCVSRSERVKAFILISSTIFPLLFIFISVAVVFLYWVFFSHRKCSINIYGLRFLFACRCIGVWWTINLIFFLRFNYYFCCFVISFIFCCFIVFLGRFQFTVYAADKRPSHSLSHSILWQDAIKYAL